MHCPECGKDNVTEDGSNDYYLGDLYHCKHCDTEFYCTVIGTRAERLAEYEKIAKQPSELTGLLKTVYLPLLLDGIYKNGTN